MKKRSFTYLVILIIFAVLLYVLFIKHEATTIKNEVELANMRNLSTVLSASTVVNYLTKQANPKKGVTIDNCSDVISFLNLDSYYQVIEKPIKSRSIQRCTLVGRDNKQLEFYSIGIK
jgi:hypothetical protein